MKKTIRMDNVYYTIAWSPLYQYDKYDAIRIVPELAGIINVLRKRADRYEHLLFFSCWRDGCRIALRKIMDQELTKFPQLFDEDPEKKYFYRYTVVDTSMQDMQDILSWLIGTYGSLYNTDNFPDSGRYRLIHLKESYMKPGQVVEKLNSPGSPV